MAFNVKSRNAAIKAVINQATELWLGLSRTAPNPDGTGISEPPSSTGYKRIKIVNSPSVWSDATNGTIVNIPKFEFDQFILDGGVATHWFLSTTVDGIAEIFDIFTDANGVPQTRPLVAGSVLWIAEGSISFKAVNK